MNTDVPSPTIKLLPEHLIDQIKAGEVIERPASLLKELLENAIDANAENIHIQIRENGLELIAIEDDGDGMSFDDLPYAFCRHATSKIDKFEDIYALHSYGFRGEALASVASSSRVTCTSRPLNGAAGKITIHGGKEISHDLLTSPHYGTSFFIKDLFYNTPARFKFIKSKISEKNALKKILFSFIITQPTINFSVKWDDQEKIFFSALKKGEDLRKRFIQLLAKKWRVDDFHILSAEYDGYKLTALWCKEGSKGNSGKQQFLFANERLFNDLSLHRSVVRGLEKFWGVGLTGHYIFSLQVPAAQLDVNVHPNKTHVKFFAPNIIYSLISGSIDKFYNDLDKSLLPTTIPHENTHPPSCTNAKNDANNPDLGAKPGQDQRPGQEGEHGGHTNNIFSPQENNSSNKYFEFSINPFENIFMGKIKTCPEYLLVLKKDQFLNYFMTFHYANFTKHPDQDPPITPLLICESFHASLTSWQSDFLVTIGFEFDPLNEQTLMLRTIPNFIGQLPTKQFASVMLAAIREIKISPQRLNLNIFLEQLATMNYWKDMPLFSFHYAEMLESIDFTCARDYPFLTKLSEENF